MCHDELTTHCVNACSKKLWPSAANGFTVLLTVDAEVFKRKSHAMILSGVGLSGMREQEISDELLNHAGKK